MLRERVGKDRPLKVIYRLFLAAIAALKVLIFASASVTNKSKSLNKAYLRPKTFRKS